jgi:hypothetical protein
LSSDDQSEASGAPDHAYDPALWELALRLIPQQYGPTGPSNVPPRIWPGCVPDLPFDLPVPQRARVVGGYGRGKHLTVLIDTDASPKECIAFYREHMFLGGWSTPAWHVESGGFAVPQVTHQAQALLCQGDRGPALSIFTQAAGDEITHMTLTINLDTTNNPCLPPVEPEQYQMSVGPHIPPLGAPPDCTLVSYGTSGGPGLSTAFATLTTDLDLTAVVTHYDQQLAEAGWHLVDNGRSGPVAWSAWTLVDRMRSSAHGTLTVIQEPDEATSYALCLHTRGSEPELPKSGE